jgi:hypothetical protein
LVVVAIAARYKGYRYPIEVIRHAVWLYHRFALSLRDVEELMLARGVVVTYETIRSWCAKFGPDYAAQLRRRRPRPGDKWHFDEVFVRHRQVIWECLWRSRCEWTGWRKGAVGRVCCQQGRSCPARSGCSGDAGGHLRRDRRGLTTFKALREALYADTRFVRASQLSWGLRAWGMRAYSSIAEQMGARIDATGGETNIDELIADLRSRFPDVAESPIRTNLTSLAFITDGIMVRRRTDSDNWPDCRAAVHHARGFP